jgi:hypothetical protein
MKIRVSVSTDKHGSTVQRDIEVDDGEVEGMDEEERRRYLEESAKEVAFEMMHWDWRELREDE